MSGPVGAAKRTGRRLYRALPAGARARTSAILHGETRVQRSLLAGLRDARTRLGNVPGAGDLIVGSARPYRAQVVTGFDAEEHLGRLAEVVVEALAQDQVPAYRLPGQWPPVLVVSGQQWERAWRLLAAGAADSGLWAAIGTRLVAVAALGSAPERGSVDLFRRLVSSDGGRVADREECVRLERWTEIGREGVERVDGGTFEVGTLVSEGGPKNGFASYITPQVQAALLEPEPRFKPSVDAVVEPVDIVYTWVDGADQAWLAERARWSGEGFTPDAQIASRFESHDELRYSLRSVEMYANWFNHLYLVTDAQLPAWLNLAHPRLTVVDHRDIFTPDELPVFNSHAIESRLHHIAGLSDRFIYLNDDVFFGRPVRPEQFFTGAGQPKFFPSKATIDPGPSRADDVSVTSAAKNNRALLEAALGRTITTKLKHTPHAHRVAVLSEMEERFPEVFAANVAARFRSHTDHSVLSGLAQRYGAATGRAVVGGISYNYADISRPDIESVLARWLRDRRFAVFCLNDTGSSEVDGPARRALTAFLQSYFPLTSGFESDRP